MGEWGRQVAIHTFLALSTTTFCLKVVNKYPVFNSGHHRAVPHTIAFMARVGEEKRS